MSRLPEGRHGRPALFETSSASGVSANCANLEPERALTAGRQRCQWRGFTEFRVTPY